MGWSQPSPSAVYPSSHEPIEGMTMGTHRHALVPAGRGSIALQIGSGSTIDIDLLFRQLLLGSKEI